MPDFDIVAKAHLSSFYIAELFCIYIAEVRERELRPTSALSDIGTDRESSGEPTEPLRVTSADRMKVLQSLLFVLSVVQWRLFRRQYTSYETPSDSHLGEGPLSYDRLGRSCVRHIERGNDALISWCWELDAQYSLGQILRSPSNLHSTVHGRGTPTSVMFHE